MTMLYSIYYEFSKRYPHGKSTVIKQDSTSAKIELVFRMLNYTLGEETFKEGLQKFMKDRWALFEVDISLYTYKSELMWTNQLLNCIFQLRQYKNFFGDDIWNSLTDQARISKKIDADVSVNDIAASWITKDRLPVVDVGRNYDSKTAVLRQVNRTSSYFTDFSCSYLYLRMLILVTDSFPMSIY